jgi:hypothetical protein
MLRELFAGAILLLGVIEPPPVVPSPSSSTGPAIASSAAAQESAAPRPTTTPKEPLREIGRVRAITSFCKAFITHFNNSARLMLANDEEISYVDFTLGSLENHFRQVSRDNLLHTDRINLMAYVKALQQQLPKLQEQINQLRRVSEITKDPEEAKQTREVAAQLQKSYDRQHAIELDALSVIHVMMEMAASKGEGPSSFQQMLGAQTPTLAPAITPVGISGDFDFLDSQPADRRDIRSYLRMQFQRDRIGDAESNATKKAEAVASNC